MGLLIIVAFFLQEPCEGVLSLYIDWLGEWYFGCKKTHLMAFMGHFGLILIGWFGIRILETA